MRKEGFGTSVVFLDVAKAFDTVNIDGLLYKRILLKFSPLVLTLHKNMYYNSHTQGPVCVAVVINTRILGISSYLHS